MLLEAGCRWKLGDSQSINVWFDPWLRDSNNIKVETPMYEEYNFLTVSNLFIPGSRCWNLSLLRIFFNERDVKVISSIPCTFGPTKDT